MSDEKLGKNDADVETVSVSSVYVRHKDFLKKFLSRYLQREHDIEDVVQEAYLKAYIAEGIKGPIEYPKAFLFSIAKNLAINELNRKSRQMTAYIEECSAPYFSDSESTTEGEVEGEQSLGIYCEAVAALPEKCRRVFLLRKVHGLTHKEIAAKLGVSLSTVEKHLRLGVLSCRDYIRKHDDSWSTNSLEHRAERRTAGEDG